MRRLASPTSSFPPPVDLVVDDERKLACRQGGSVMHGPSPLERDVLIFSGSADISDRAAFRAGIAGEQLVAVGVGLCAPAVESVRPDASLAVLETAHRHVVEQLWITIVLGDPDAFRDGLRSCLGHIDGV